MSCASNGQDIIVDRPVDPSDDSTQNSSNCLSVHNIFEHDTRTKHMEPIEKSYANGKCKSSTRNTHTENK